jgi:hypothetical protein
MRENKKRRGFHKNQTLDIREIRGSIFFGTGTSYREI